jgi:leader peptidase (prepilin peptidase) / N-methyltransferase
VGLQGEGGGSRYAAGMGQLTVAILVGVAGLAAGSAASVVIDQVRRPERAGRPRSLPLVELTMGVVWFLLARRLAGAGLGWAIPAYLALAFVCLALAVIDATTRLLPNRLTYPAFPAVAGLLLVASVALGDLGRLGRSLAAAAGVGALFLLLAMSSPGGGMGLGDVKLAPTLGLALGWLSWGTLAVGLVAGFLLGGLAGLAAMLVLRCSRKTQLPFGPWLIAGALLAVLVGEDVARWYGHLGM